MPPPKVAESLLNVLPLTVMVASLRRPPPKEAESLLNVLPLTCMAPSLRRPPPLVAKLLLKVLLPMVAEPALYSPPPLVLLPLTVWLAAPGPAMVRLLAMAIGPLVNVMEPRLAWKVMVSPDAALPTRARSEPLPVSPLLVTTDGTKRSSRNSSMSRGFI